MAVKLRCPLSFLTNHRRQFRLHGYQFGQDISSREFNPRVKLPARDILAELVAVEPKLTSVVSEKGERTPEFNCHLLPPEPPEQLPVVRQTVPVSSGKVNVRSAVKSAVVIVPVKKAAPELLGERLKESALATLESKVNRESVSTLKRKSPAPPTV